MKTMCVCLCLCLCLWMATLAAGQAKKGAPAASGSQAKKAAPAGGVASIAAKICDDPYVVREDADGWPEGPVTILFHHEKSKAPWAKNPAIRVAGLEAVTPGSARTLVCVGEHDLIRRDHTDSLVRAIPGAELFVVPGASHSAIQERPDLVNPRVLAFLMQAPLPASPPGR